MAQLFGDGCRDAARDGFGGLVRFWTRAAGDLVRSATAEWWAAVKGGETMGWKGTIVGLLTLLGGAAFGWLCLHTDEAGVLAMSVMLLAFALGQARPRQAWLAALIGLGAPFGQALGHRFGWPVPYPNGPVPGPNDWADVAGIGIPLLFSAAGAAAGACCGLDHRPGAGSRHWTDRVAPAARGWSVYRRL